MENRSKGIFMGSSFKVATVGGIQIRIDWTWLLAFAFFTWSLGAYYDNTFHRWGSGTAYLVGAISTLLLFVTVLLHELGHSFTARSLGLPVNTITLYIFGGVSSLTQEPKSPRIEFLVTIAGPLVSLILAGIFYLLHAAAGSASSEVVAVLGYLASVNLILGLFNLIPAYPLDGGRVLHSIIWAITGSMGRATRIAATVGKFFAYLFIAAGLVEALVFGQLFSGLWLAFIGWFLNNAAGSSYQQEVIDQRLRGVDVGDVMDQAPEGVPPTVAVQSLVSNHFLDANRRAVPVQDSDGTLLGLVTLTDLRHLTQDDWPTTPVGRVMTPAASLRTVASTDDLRQAIQIMADHGYHQLPVVDHGRLVGVLDRDHVVQYLHRSGSNTPRQGGTRTPETQTSTSPRQPVG
jgi:Zn-dependent protease/CBS domain-containing protein